MLGIVQTINAYLSDYVLVFLLVAVGVWYTVKTRFVQVRCLGEGLKGVFGNLSLNGGKHGGGKVPSRRWQRPLPHRWEPALLSAAAVPF